MGINIHHRPGTRNHHRSTKPCRRSPSQQIRTLHRQAQKGSPYYNINTGQKEIAPDKKIVQFTPHKGFRFDDTPDVPSTGSNVENKQE